MNKVNRNNYVTSIKQATTGLQLPMKSLKKLCFLVLLPHVGVVNICTKEKYDTKAKTKHKSIVF